jgi:5'-nucleotidase
MKKKILYVDMDNVLVDFRSAFSKVDPALLTKFENDKDEIPRIFALWKRI